MTMLTLRDFPMPPSANNCYRNLSFKGRPGRVKTKEYKAFEVEAGAWGLKHAVSLNMARAMTEELSHNTAFRIDLLFYFHKDRIIMKSDGKQPNSGLTARRRGEPKTNDTSNRVKPLEDALASLLGIDDCWFWAGSHNKTTVAAEGLPESVDILLTYVDHHNSREFVAELEA